MNIHQKNYIAARALAETITSIAKSKHPAPPELDASHPGYADAWDAHFEACEDINSAEGVWKAKTALFDAENALIEWASTTAPGRASKLNFREAARHLDIRAKLIDICMRYAGE